MAALQIRNVPEDVHRRLKERATAAGMSLSEYALAELLASLERPTMAELLARVASRPPVDVPEGLVVELIRADRDSQ
jgi:plasmid stability protein